MSTFNKVSWVLGIGMVIALIMMTNTMDKKHFGKVKNSVVTIYEDRLLAKNIVFELSRLMHEKDLANALSDAEFFGEKNKAINKNIEELTSRFSTTKLISDEQKVLADLERNFSKLKEAEAETNLIDKAKYQEFSQKISNNLTALSNIQLEEGKRQSIISRDAVNQIEYFTKIENWILIILAVIMIAGVIYQPKKS